MADHRSEKLVKAAAERVAATKPRKATPKPQSGKEAKPALLAGGNPQIAKAEGDAPVQAYIAAMPGWKSEVGRRLDAVIVRTVPACARRSNGTRHFTASRARAGSCRSMSSPATSK